MSLTIARASKCGPWMWSRRCLILLATLAVGTVAPASLAAADGDMSGTVSYITVRFQPASHSKMPTASQVGDTNVELMQDDTGLYASGDAPSGAKPITLQVKQLRGYQLSDGAVNAVQQAVVQRVNAMGIGSVAVRLKTPEEGDTGGATVNVVAGTVEDVRAKAVDEDGERPASADNIEKWSPVQTDDTEAALLNVEEVNEYLNRLNRFPGRSVTASISAGENPGSILLDYLVTREQTFNIWAQVSNTGTEATSEWVEQFGLFLTQISGNDDILSVTAMTGNFEDSTRSLTGYYDSRFGDLEGLRYRVTGNWGDYTSEDVGFMQQDFSGSTWGAQADLIWNVFQDQALFIDLDIGFRYWNSSAKNVVFNTVTLADGNSDFYTPSLSLSLFEIKPESSIQATIGFNYTSAGGTETDLNDLGRHNTSPDWYTLYATGQASFFLDQIFDPGLDGAAVHPMVHELTVRGQGQYAFEHRLTPLAMTTLGGYYTVRGYPQSAVAGDTAVQGTVEYRLHLPRTFEPQPAGQGLFGDDDFRWSPDSATGAMPDWDLALLGFFDAGAIWISDAYSYENNMTLMGAGVGVELSIRQNLKFTVNYGWALKDAETIGVESGDARFYFLGSVSF